MKILDVSSITDSSEMPLKKGTLQFLQDSYKEIMSYVMTALAGGGDYDPTKVYILFGALNSGSGSTYNITAGAAFFNGEVFAVNAASFTASGANVAVFQIVQTQYTTDADPVTFTDSAVRNVHNIRKLQIIQGATGAELGNYTDAIFLDFKIPAQLNLTVLGNAELSGVYPNLIITASGDPKDTVKMFVGDTTFHFNATGLGVTAAWTGWAIANGQNGTKDLRGRVPMQMTNADSANHGYSNDVKNVAAYNTVGNYGGEEKHLLTTDELPEFVLDIPTSDNGTANGSQQNPAWSDNENVAEGLSHTNAFGGDEPHNNLQPYFVLCFVQKIV